MAGVGMHRRAHPIRVLTGRAHTLTAAAQRPADRLGTGVAPGLDRLAAASVQFTAARATVPLTLPSHATIHTGLVPPAHGIRENGLDALSDRHSTIATLLKKSGYQTAAFVGAFVLDRRFGLAQGFDSYDDRIPRDPNASDRLEAERPASAVIDAALAWLAEHTPDSAHPAPSTQHPAPEVRRVGGRLVAASRCTGRVFRRFCLLAGREKNEVIDLLSKRNAMQFSEESGKSRQ